MKDYKDSFLFQVRRIRAKLQKNSKAKNIQQCKSNLVAQRLVSWSHSWSSVFQKACVHTVYLIDSSWLNSTPATDVGVHSTLSFHWNWSCAFKNRGSSLQEIQQCHTVPSPFFSLHVFNTSIKWETFSHYSVQAPTADTALASSWTTSCELTVKKYFPEDFAQMVQVSL